MNVKRLSKLISLLFVISIVTTPSIAFAEKPLRVDVPVFKQTWMPWGNEKLGFSEGLIQNRGCALLSVAMVMKYFGVDTNPSELNEWLKNNGGYMGGNLVWSAVSKMDKRATFVNKIKFENGVDFKFINAQLDKGIPLIAQLEIPKIGMHFLVLTGHTGNDYFVNDSSYEDVSNLLSQLHGDPSTIIKSVVLYRGPTKELVPLVSYKSRYDDKKTAYMPSLVVPDMKVTLNSKELLVNSDIRNMEVPPRLINNTTFIPLRSVLEELGANIDWNPEDEKITIELQERMIEMWNNKRGYYVNGWFYEFDVPPQIIDARTMIPLRGVLEKIGTSVNWNAHTQEIIIGPKFESGN